MQQIRKMRKQKRVRKPNSFVSVGSTWCGIKDDYRTLVELKDVSVVNSYDSDINKT
jgi:hypothetical protein